MATDYREVLNELREEEKRLLEELDVIRGMIPGAELMAKRMPQQSVPVEKEGAESTPTSKRPFEGMGTKDAILKLLGTTDKPLLPSEMIPLLKDGGVYTKAVDFAGSVSSTLTQMRGDNLIERLDNGWRLIRAGSRSSEVFVSKPAENSLSKLLYPAPNAY